MYSALDIANRALERERWARDKLAEHAGRVVRVDIVPARETFAVNGEGRLEGTNAAPDLRLTISPLRLPALLAQPERWDELVATEGDAKLAATLSELALTLPWFVEALFAKAFGPVMGQRVADIGRRLLALPHYAAGRFSDSVASYIGDEVQLAAGVAEFRIVASEIATFAARVDALAVRIDALHGMTAPTATGPSPGKDAARTRHGPPR